MHTLCKLPQTFLMNKQDVYMNSCKHIINIFMAYVIHTVGLFIISVVTYPREQH